MDKFSLKWNEFHSNVSSSFGILRNDEHLHDVTLVTENFEQIMAHKLVLSVSSDYFHSLFNQNKSSNLMLCLEGVSKQDINNMLDYMYNGEVQIYQDDLDRFLNVAQRFQFKGLLNIEKVEDDDSTCFIL